MINEVIAVVFAEVINRGHRQAFCRADRGAKSTEHAFAHVDVEGRQMQALHCAISGTPEVAVGPKRFDRDAIYRTDARALVAADASSYQSMSVCPALLTHVANLG